MSHALGGRHHALISVQITAKVAAFLAGSEVALSSNLLLLLVREGVHVALRLLREVVHWAGEVLVGGAHRLIRRVTTLLPD